MSESTFIIAFILWSIVPLLSCGSRLRDQLDPCVQSFTFESWFWFSIYMIVNYVLWIPIWICFESFDDKSYRKTLIHGITGRWG